MRLLLFLRRVLRDPAWCFLAIGAAVGLTLAVVTPTFSATDETGHFARAYQLSEGHLLTKPSVFDDAEHKGSGVCLPDDVYRDLQRKSFELYLENAKYSDYGAPATPQTPARLTATTPTPSTTPSTPAAPEAASAQQCPAGRSYIDISTFGWYSPIAYAPAALTFAVLRPFDASATTLAGVGRIVDLLVFLGLVFLAIRRAPRARWALCISALTPIVVFQANSLSPDTMTTAAAILVVSSALRLLDHEGTRIPRAMLLEAIGLSLLLGLVKPSYSVIALLYLLPLLDRARRRSSWVLLVPVAVAVGVSGLWQRASSSRFVCDVRFFGVEPSPSDQVHKMVSAPWQVVEAVVRSVPEHGGRWIRDLVPVADRIMVWPLAVSVLAAIGFVVLACQQDRPPRRPIRISERVAILGVFVIGLFAVLGGWLVYCSAPGLDLLVHPNARLFAPLLPVLLVGLAPDGKRATRFGNLAVPPAVALVLFYAVWCVDVARGV